MSRALRILLVESPDELDERLRDPRVDLEVVGRVAEVDDVRTVCHHTRPDAIMLGVGSSPPAGDRLRWLHDLAASGPAPWHPSSYRPSHRPSRIAIEASLSALSKREHEVLRAVAYGYTNREVAEHLGISVKSIETYRYRLSDKLGFASRADLVRFALDAGLLTPGDEGLPSVDEGEATQSP